MGEAYRGDFSNQRKLPINVRKPAVVQTVRGFATSNTLNQRHKIIRLYLVSDADQVFHLLRVLDTRELHSAEYIQPSFIHRARSYRL